MDTPPKVGDIVDGKVVVDPKHMLRGDKGRWLPGQLPKNAMTSDRARELATLRWTKAEQATRAAIKAKALDGSLNANSAPEAFGAAVGEVYAGAVANAMDRPHDAARALKFVGQAAGLLRPQERQSNLPQGGVWQINIGDSVVESMRRDGYELGDIVDADSTGGG
jgi:hypothetical protein